MNFLSEFHPLVLMRFSLLQAMNYNSVILVGCVALTAFWWWTHGRTQYPGPRLPHLDAAGHKIEVDI
jgi:hypothetical protein